MILFRLITFNALHRPAFLGCHDESKSFPFKPGDRTWKLDDLIKHMTALAGNVTCLGPGKIQLVQSESAPALSLAMTLYGKHALSQQVMRTLEF